MPNSARDLDLLDAALAPLAVVDVLTAHAVALAAAIATIIEGTIADLVRP